MNTNTLTAAKKRQVKKSGTVEFDETSMEHMEALNILDSIKDADTMRRYCVAELNPIIRALGRKRMTKHIFGFIDAMRSNSKCQVFLILSPSDVFYIPGFLRFNNSPFVLRQCFLFNCSSIKCVKFSHSFNDTSTDR